MALPQSTVEMLRCPQCRERVVEDNDRLICCNREQRQAFPVRDGIPVMIVDEAEIVSADEWDAIMQRQTSEGSSS